MMPLYGFLEGDTLVMVILAEEDEPVRALADRLLQAAGVRVPRRGPPEVRVGGRVLAPQLTVAGAGLKALDRFDVFQEEVP